MYAPSETGEFSLSEEMHVRGQIPKSEISPVQLLLHSSNLYYI